MGDQDAGWEQHLNVLQRARFRVRRLARRCRKKLRLKTAAGGERPGNKEPTAVDRNSKNSCPTAQPGICRENWTLAHWCWPCLAFHNFKFLAHPGSTHGNLGGFWEPFLLPVSGKDGEFRLPTIAGGVDANSRLPPGFMDVRTDAVASGKPTYGRLPLLLFLVHSSNSKDGNVPPTTFCGCNVYPFLDGFGMFWVEFPDDFVWIFLVRSILQSRTSFGAWSPTQPRSNGAAIDQMP